MLTDREVFISIVDNDLLTQSDAIILLEGDGFSRYKHATELYKKDLAPLIVFSGAIVNYDYGSIPFKDIKDKIIDEGVPESALIHENRSLNTREQAVEVTKIAETRNWKRIILVGSCEHQYRAYLTFLRSIQELKYDLIIFNSPPNGLSWFKEDIWGKRIDRLQQEFDRIEKYSKSGHLATYQEAIKYQEWKEKLVLK